MERHYANALLAAISGRTKIQSAKLLKNFFALIERRGHQRLLRGVARELSRASDNIRRRSTLHIASTKKLTRTNTASFKRKYPELFKGITDVTFSVEPKIVGGTVLKSFKERLDLSYRRALLEMYKRFTQNHE